MTLTVVTGATSGIGLELARLAAADGHDLVLVARGADALRRVADELSTAHKVTAESCAADLSTQEGVDAVTAAIAGRPVEVLANNAGIGGMGRFSEQDEDTAARMLGLNVTALTLLTRRLLPGMVARGSGRILNVASTAGFQPGPFMAVYYASKAYVISLSEALAEECAGTGVTVTALCPGFTETNFAATAEIPHGSLLSRMPAGPDAAGVARAGWAGATAGRRIVVPGLANAAAVQSLRIAPRRLVTKMVRRLHPV